MSKPSDRPLRPLTTLVGAGQPSEWTGGVVNPAVWRASTILFDDCADLAARSSRNRDGELYYGRRGTPTQWALAEALTELEPGAEGTMALSLRRGSSGGGAALVLSLGDELLLVDSCYQPTRAFTQTRAGADGRHHPLPTDPIERATPIFSRTRPGPSSSKARCSLTFEVQGRARHLRGGEARASPR